MKMRVVGPWVVYQAAVRGRPGGTNAVCEASEWDAMEEARPGFNTLVRSGIVTEGEAERLARGTSGDSAPRTGARARLGVLLGIRAAPPVAV